MSKATPRVIAPVTIELDGPRHLLFDFTGMAHAERELARFWGLKRISILKVIREGEIGIGELACILCGGLKHESPELTMEAVLTLLSQSDLAEVYRQLDDALVQQWGITKKPIADKEGAGAHPDPPQSSTGPSSGPSPATTSD